MASERNPTPLREKLAPIIATGASWVHEGAPVEFPFSGKKRTPLDGKALPAQKMKRMSIMQHTDDANAFFNVSQEEIEAVDSLRHDIDEEEINFRKLFNEQLKEAEAWQHKDNKYCTLLYEKLEKTYTLYIMCLGDPKREQLVDRKCDEYKIVKTAASNLCIRLVKLIFRRSDKTAYQYASVLRYASRKDIAHDALAQELAKKGNGIAEWATRFGEEFPTQQRAASSSDSGRRSMGPGDDDSDSDGLADTNNEGYEHNEDNEREVDDAASDQPDVEWGPKALKKWRKSEVDGGAWLFVQRLGENRARIIKKSIPKS
jgi:hypothetical protein